jgi:hypothetical protein
METVRRDFGGCVCTILMQLNDATVLWLIERDGSKNATILAKDGNRTSTDLRFATPAKSRRYCGVYATTICITMDHLCLSFIDIKSYSGIGMGLQASVPSRSSSHTSKSGVPIVSLSRRKAPITYQDCNPISRGQTSFPNCDSDESLCIYAQFTQSLVESRGFTQPNPEETPRQPGRGHSLHQSRKFSPQLTRRNTEQMRDGEDTNSSRNAKLIVSDHLIIYKRV